MKARAVIRPQADRDIDREASYLAGQRDGLGQRFYEAAETTFQQLAEMPTIGGLYEFRRSKRRKRPVDDLRVWPIKGFGNHLIFYRPIPDGIEVVRVLHGARDINASFFD